MELSVQLTCPCRPGFTYKNITTHKKSKLHQTWEANQIHKSDKIRSKEFENEIERLKRRVTHKEAVEVALLNRINQLEEEILYWKTASEGVYVN
jgi:hypothetical protein